MSKSLLLIFALLFFGTNYTTAQSESIADFAEEEPSFPGGEEDMMKFIQNNIEYPQLAVDAGEQGIVYAQFVVYKDGHLGDFRIMRGVSTSLDRETLRILKLMPKWVPGKQKGKLVNVRYTLPIHFRLDESKSNKTKKEERKAEREKKRMMKHNK
jgi:TonB family protein